MSKESELGATFTAWDEDSKRVAETAPSTFNEQFKQMDEIFGQCTQISKTGQRCVLRIGHSLNFDSSEFNGNSHDYGGSTIGEV